MLICGAAIGLVMAAAQPAGGAVEVRQAQGRISIQATGVPLRQLLDSLARETGMKVLYEGAAPERSLTVQILDRSPAEAVMALLEGLGLNYALMLDSSGSGVQTLLFTGPPAEGTSRAAPAVQDRKTTTRPRQEEPPPETEEPPEAPAPQSEPAPGAASPLPGANVPRYPRSPFTPGVEGPPPGAEPQPPMDRPPPTPRPSPPVDQEQRRQQD